jgi:predicted molibdopterin-dependent oxidoreductase YjgC
LFAITDRVKGKQVYLPMNDSKDAAINLLTSSYADKDTDPSSSPLSSASSGETSRNTLGVFSDIPFDR